MVRKPKSLILRLFDVKLEVLFFFFQIGGTMMMINACIVNSSLRHITIGHLITIPSSLQWMREQTAIEADLCCFHLFYTVFLPLTPVGSRKGNSHNQYSSFVICTGARRSSNSIDPISTTSSTIGKDMYEFCLQWQHWRYRYRQANESRSSLLWFWDTFHDKCPFFVKGFCHGCVFLFGFWTSMNGTVIGGGMELYRCTTNLRRTIGNRNDLSNTSVVDWI